MTISLINRTKGFHPSPFKEFSLLEINGRSFFSFKRTINYHKSHAKLFGGIRIEHEVDLLFFKFKYESEIEEDE